MKTLMYVNLKNRSGREFVLVNDEARTVAYGNTAATRHNVSDVDSAVEVKTLRDLRDFFHDTLAYGYKEEK